MAVIGALWVAADAEPAAGPVELETVTVTATKTEHPALLNMPPPCNMQSSYPTRRDAGQTMSRGEGHSQR